MQRRTGRLIVGRTPRDQRVLQEGRVVAGVRGRLDKEVGRRGVNNPTMALVHGRKG